MCETGESTPEPQDTPPPTVHSLFYGDRDDSAELESTCTCTIDPYATTIHYCNAVHHSFLTTNSFTRPPDANNPVNDPQVRIGSQRWSHGSHGSHWSQRWSQSSSFEANRDARTPLSTTMLLQHESTSLPSSARPNCTPPHGGRPPDEAELDAFPPTPTIRANVLTMYKRKGKKINPVNVALPDGRRMIYRTR